MLTVCVKKHLEGQNNSSFCYEPVNQQQDNQWPISTDYNYHNKSCCQCWPLMHFLFVCWEQGVWFWTFDAFPVFVCWEQEVWFWTTNAFPVFVCWEQWVWFWTPCSISWRLGVHPLGETDRSRLTLFNCANLEQTLMSALNRTPCEEVPCGSTGTSGNSQETETCMVWACHMPQQPLQNHPPGHLWGWVTLWSAEEMLNGQHQGVDTPAHARTAHNHLLQKTLG